MNQNVNGLILSGDLQAETESDIPADLAYEEFGLVKSNLTVKADGGRDYVDILQAEYRRRKTKNALYSVRAFAMHLRIHVSALSRILNRKQALSLKAATVIVKNLDLSPEDQQRFLLSIASQRVDEIVDRLSKPLDSRLRISFEQS